MSTRKAGVSFARWILYTWRALERLIFWKSLLIVTGSRVKIISTAYAPTERTLVMDRWWAEEFLDGVNGWQQRVKSDDYCERWKGLLKSGEDNLSSREKTVKSNSSEKTGALQSVYSIVNGADDRSCWEASYSMLWWSWILSDDRWQMNPSVRGEMNKLRKLYYIWMDLKNIFISSAAAGNIPTPADNTGSRQGEENNATLIFFYKHHDA